MDSLKLNDYLLVRDAAKFLGVSEATLRSWSKSGHITTRRSPGGYRLYDKKDLEDLLISIESTRSPANFTK